jgi:hypothetical protein
MAGLLDLFMPSEDPVQAQMRMALSAGLLSANGSKGLAAGLLGASDAQMRARAAQAEAEDRKLKRGLLEAQIDETKAQARERAQKMALAQAEQARQDRLLFGDPRGVSAGAFAPSADGFGPTMPQGAAPQAGGLVARAKAAGIPEDVIQSDLAFNNGKKISEYLNARATPKWENVNGNLVNTNEQGFRGGFQPGFSVSANGQATAWQPDGNGGLVFGAPKGAIEAYRAYQDTGEAAKARRDLVTVTPQNGPPQMTTREALATNPQVSGQIQPGQQAQMDQGRVEILNQELTKAQAQLRSSLQTGDTAAANRAANDVAALNNELRRAGGGSRATVGMPLQSEAEKVRATKDAEAAAGRDATMEKGAANSRDTMGYIKEARNLFKKGPTASGVGTLIDAAASAVGYSTPGADAAAQLDTLSGWMVSNVPRMEGPQSNFDVQNYKTMAGMVGDKTKPLSQRMAALDTLEKLQEKYAHLNGGGEAKRDTPQLAAPTPGMVKGGYRFKGGNPADPNRWEKM